jgi:hypothetical protein
MKHIHLDKIKSYESDHKILNLFSNKEIEMIKKLYSLLPIRVFNKKQNIIKKIWEQDVNKELDEIYFNKIRKAIGDFVMDTMVSKSGKNYYGIFHESFSPLKIHVDTGFDENAIIYKQLVTPLSSIGETVFFKKRWYGKSTTFTIDEEELKTKINPDQNERSSKHIGSFDFDKLQHQKYLSHIDINNLKGLEIDFIYKWKVGETLVVDRSCIHCSSSNIVDKKLGLTTFTKKKL